MLSAFYKDIRIPLLKPLNCYWDQVSCDRKCVNILIQAEHGMVLHFTVVW